MAAEMPARDGAGVVFGIPVRFVVWPHGQSFVPGRTLGSGLLTPWHGSFRTPEAGRLVRWVMIIAALMAVRCLDSRIKRVMIGADCAGHWQVLAIAQGIIALADGQTFNASTALALLIPLCGWFGARNRSEQLLRAFTICNAICATLFGLVFIVTVGFTIPSSRCVCDDVCFEEQFGGNSTMTGPGNSAQVRVDFCDNLDSYITATIVALILGCAACILQVRWRSST